VGKGAIGEDAPRAAETGETETIHGVVEDESERLLGNHQILRKGTLWMMLEDLGS
jgi:hypothetical protein